MYIYLIRHGQSRGNLGLGYRDDDPDLTPTGCFQAKRAAEALKKGDHFAPPVSTVYASPMTRALKTAGAIAETLDLIPQVWPELCETPRPSWGKEPRDIGKAGLTSSELNERFPRWLAHPSMVEDAAWWDFLSIEDRDAAYLRAGRMINSLTTGAVEEENSIALVTHGAFGSALIATAIGADPVNHNAFNQYNCAISLLHFEKKTDKSSGFWRLKYLNRSEHLNPELKTDLTF